MSTSSPSVAQEAKRLSAGGPSPLRRLRSRPGRDAGFESAAGQ
ncbi:hypothetical protein [Actinoallomurus iriomotensis]|nr:hypothetical protein [Actinoallomurus iriomotensis]